MSTVQEEAQDSILHTLIGRLRNPFFSSFALAWLAIHWRAVYATVVMSVDELPYRNAKKLIRFPDKLSYMNYLDYTWLDHLLWPALLGALLPVVLKWVGGFVHLYVEDAEKWLNRKRQARLEGAFKPIAEYDAMVGLCETFRRRTVELQRDLNELEKSLRTEADALKQKNDEFAQVFNQKLNTEWRLEEIAEDLHGVYTSAKASSVPAIVSMAGDRAIGEWGQINEGISTALVRIRELIPSPRMPR